MTEQHLANILERSKTQTFGGVEVYNLAIELYEAQKKIEALQQEVSQLKAELSANPGALSQDKGESVQAELTAEETLARFDRKWPKQGRIIDGEIHIGYDNEWWPCVGEFELIGIRREVKYYDLQASSFPLEGIEPQPIAEISNLAKPGSQSTDNGECEASEVAK